MPISFMRGSLRARRGAGAGTRGEDGTCEISLPPRTLQRARGRAALGAATAALGAATAALAAAGEDPFSPAALESRVRALASDSMEGRGPGSKGHAAARALVLEALRGASLEPAPGMDGEFEEPFHSRAGDGMNLVAALPGSDPARAGEWIVVSAHYDHLGRGANGTIFNGADDDASGVAVLLAVAESYRAEAPGGGSRPPRSLLFAVTDLEEKGLWGGFHLAEEPPVPLEAILADVNLEVLGNEISRERPRTFTITGAEYDGAGVLRAEAIAAAETEGLALRFLSDALIGPRGDHHAFLLQGVPAVMLAAGTTALYHTPDDDPESLDYGKLSAVARFVRRYVDALAAGARKPAFAEPEDGPLSEDALAAAELLEALAREGGRALSAAEREKFSTRAVTFRGWSGKARLSDEEKKSLAAGFLDGLYTIRKAGLGDRRAGAPGSREVGTPATPAPPSAPPPTPPRSGSR